MKLIISLFLVICMMPATVSAKNSYGIAVTVNDEAISEGEVGDRMKLVMISGGMKNTSANRARARAQAINILIDETLKVQEAERNNIDIQDDEVENGFGALAAQNKMTSEEFSSLLKKQGIPKATLLKQIKSDIAWRKVVTGALRSKIKISENDVNARMDRIKDNIGKREYNVFEIFMPVQNESDDKKIKELANRIVKEIRDGRAPFPAAASQFSAATSAEKGGSLGWVAEGNLPKELNDVMLTLNKGQVSAPIKSLSGYYILSVADIRTASGETMPEPDDVLNEIGLERLDRLQKRTLSDLRSAAFIERRDQ